MLCFVIIHSIYELHLLLFLLHYIDLTILVTLQMEIIKTTCYEPNKNDDVLLWINLSLHKVVKISSTITSCWFWSTTNLYNNTDLCPFFINYPISFTFNKFGEQVLPRHLFYKLKTYEKLRQTGSRWRCWAFVCGLWSSGEEGGWGSGRSRGLDSEMKLPTVAAVRTLK